MLSKSNRNHSQSKGTKIINKIPKNGEKGENMKIIARKVILCEQPLCRCLFEYEEKDVVTVYGIDTIEDMYGRGMRNVVREKRMVTCPACKRTYTIENALRSKLPRGEKLNQVYDNTNKK